MHKIKVQSAQSLKLLTRFNGQEISCGTGFVVMTHIGPVLFTNRHVVRGRDNVTDILLSPKTGAIPNELVIVHHQTLEEQGAIGSWVERVEPLYVERDTQLAPLWLEHPILGAKADFVAIPLTQVDGVCLYTHDLATADVQIEIGPAEVVSVIGFPFGKSAQGFAVWATGFVASDPSIDYDDLPVMLIDCRSRQGQSGSPVIAYRKGMFNSGDMTISMNEHGMHKFIGIYSGRINAESDLGLVWKASAIQELIDSLKPKMPNPNRPTFTSTPNGFATGPGAGYRPAGA